MKIENHKVIKKASHVMETLNDKSENKRASFNNCKIQIINYSYINGEKSTRKYMKKKENQNTQQINLFKRLFFCPPCNKITNELKIYTTKSEFN